MSTSTATSTVADALQPAIAHQQAGRYKEAVLWLESWLSSHPHDATAYALLAQLWLEEQNETAAWDAIKKARAIDARLPIVQRNAAKLYLKGRRINKAFEEAQAAWHSDKNDPENQLVLASVMSAKGQIKEALVMTEQVLQKRPDHAEAYAIRALLRMYIGQWGLVLLDIDNAISLKPHIEHYHQLRSKLLNEGMAKLETLLTKEPENIEAIVTLAEYKRAILQLEQAKQLLNRALTLNPESFQALVCLALILQKQGRFSEAATVYNKVLSMDEAMNEARHYSHRYIILTNLGVVQLEQMNISAAVEVLREAWLLKTEYQLAYFNLLVALLMDERLDEAEQRIEEGYANFGQALQYAVSCCVLAVKRKDWAKARHYMKQCRIKAPSDAISIKTYIDALMMDNQLEEAQALIKDIMQKQRNETQPESGCSNNNSNISITALLHFGRSGSMFFHSLLDGHPELLTIPGFYFKGWFGKKVWENLAPNMQDPQWRQTLITRILQEYIPLFDPRCKNNVIGAQFSASWLAKDSGFMEMGEDRSKPLVIDHKLFSSHLLALLAPLQTIDQKTCFELIHKAFESTVRGPSKAQHIFYHIHHPNLAEFVNFIGHYPNARLLYIVRHPVQGMEAWMLNMIEGTEEVIAAMKDQPKGAEQKDRYWLMAWSKAVNNVKIMFVNQLQSPFNTMVESRGVRLEDVKRNPERTMPQIVAWMGIADHPTLYKASFCGLQYWGPISKVTGAITGFDTKAIDRSVGSILGPRDITIFETLFWPFSHRFGYSTLSEAEFREQLNQIRPWLDEPLEFETRFYEKLTVQHPPLQELTPYKIVHRVLLDAWTILNRDGTYYGMVQPLELQ